MNSKRLFRSELFLLVCLFLALHAAQGYAVRDALDLEKLSTEADLVFKGTVLSSSAALTPDPWFQSVEGYHTQATQFQLVTVVKGLLLDPVVSFFHYESNPRCAAYFHPLHYQFTVGKSYLVFAKKGDGKNLRQFFLLDTTPEEQGVVRCLDNTPLKNSKFPFATKLVINLNPEPPKVGYAIMNAATGHTVRDTSHPTETALVDATEQPLLTQALKEVYWMELERLLKSPHAEDAIYGIKQLDAMSGNANGAVTRLGLRTMTTHDFRFEQVLDLLRGQMQAGDPKTAAAVFAAIGSHNPYLDDLSRRGCWSNNGPAWATAYHRYAKERENDGGKICWKDLVAVASENGKNRELALRALGFVHEPQLREPIQRWLTNKELRATATLLLIGFPGKETTAQLRSLADDPDPQVRESVARAVGILQLKECGDKLEQLLKDPDHNVRQIAAEAKVALVMDLSGDRL